MALARPAPPQEKHVCTFTVGENVGELEFINQHMCVADVKAQLDAAYGAHGAEVMGHLSAVQVQVQHPRRGRLPAELTEADDRGADAVVAESAGAHAGRPHGS